ncbi:MAG: TatD family hydrolase [Candidatus Moranbacteria bacterium]|nr:TatD family hydrolase [Candidatus Moranbacteria bacterium]MBP6034093.1 TatD family hydrolase [Candidatus Moranbacteria bacterium]MBP7695845.1 TatD family hydrolase [Candidatus Moranbacteria bacterium]
MFDVHAHLHDEAFVGDRDATVDRARAVGLEDIVTIGTDPEENRRAVACAEAYPDVWASVGLHPHFFDEEYRIWNEEYGGKIPVRNETEKESPIQYSTFDILFGDKGRIREYVAQLRKVAESSSKVIAIGECGLDYYRRQSADSNQQETITEEQKAFQREGFLAQIAIAEDLGLPLIVHTRPSLGSMPARNDPQAKRSDSGGDAYEDVFLILKSKITARPAGGKNLKSVVLHCYMGDLSVTEKFLSLPGVHFSFTGNITYKVKEGSDRDETLRMIPIERMLSETDCPYLAPVPYRGQRNEPAYVAEVVRRIALMQQMTYTEAEEQIGINTRRVFPRMFETV